MLISRKIMVLWYMLDMKTLKRKKIILEGFGKLGLAESITFYAISVVLLKKCLGFDIFSTISCFSRNN